MTLNSLVYQCPINQSSQIRESPDESFAFLLCNSTLIRHNFFFRKYYRKPIRNNRDGLSKLKLTILKISRILLLIKFCIFRDRRGISGSGISGIGRVENIFEFSTEFSRKRDSVKNALTVIAMRTFRPSLLFRFFVGSRLGFGLSLKLLHLCSLILEPDLDHAHAKASILGEGLSHLPAGFRGHLERRFELTSLGRREYRPRPFWTSTAVSWSILVQ